MSISMIEFQLLSIILIVQILPESVQQPGFSFCEDHFYIRPINSSHALSISGFGRRLGCIMSSFTSNASGYIVFPQLLVLLAYRVQWLH